MSHSSEHQRLKPVLDLARKLDIATNPHPSAVVFKFGVRLKITPKAGATSL